MPGRPFRTAAAALLLLVMLAGCGAGSAGGAAGPHAGLRAGTTPATAPTPAATAHTPGAPTGPAGARATTAASVRRPCGWRSSSTYRHVIWIWMENRSYDAVLGSSGQAPGLAGYARRCGVATRYYAITHPSLPNYVAAVAGSTYGVQTDCAPSTCPVRHPSLFSEAARAGRGWHAYAESMQERCDHRSYGRYAARHNPAVYFPRIAADCRTHDTRLGGSDGPFARALTARRLPGFTFVTPDLCHDGHDCSTSTADAWLTGWLGRIVTSPSYGAGDVAVFVTWDEGVGSDQRVATVVLAPTVRPGTRATARFTHYSLLRTTEEILGVPLLGRAADARSMRHAFSLG